MTEHADVTGTVRESGGRMTRQRAVVLETLAGVNTHPTAAELYEMVRVELPSISPGTVYRNLNVLRDLGYVIELDYGPGAAHYDARVEPHHHARCTQCGRVVDVPGEPVEDVGGLAASLEGWDITGYRLEFLGICPDCVDAQRKGQ